MTDGKDSIIFYFFPFTFKKQYVGTVPVVLGKLLSLLSSLILLMAEILHQFIGSLSHYL